jgi:hypothetical protein
MPSYTDEERARIMQESRQIIENTTPPDEQPPAVTQSDLDWALSRTMPDPLTEWRAEALLFQAKRERAQAEIREASLEARLKKYIDQSIREAIATMSREMNNAIEQERALLLAIVGQSMSEVVDVMQDEIEKSSPKVVSMKREHGLGAK